MMSRGRKERLERLRQARVDAPIGIDPNFPFQNAFIDDASRYVVAQCGRRSGKTNGLALRFFRTLEKYPKSQCIYLSLTYDSARDILWPVLQELNDKFKLGCTFVESKLWMVHPNGAKLKLMGADMKNFIKRLKGRKYPGVAIDEAQDFGIHLQSLVDDVLTPSIADYTDGWLALTGTPGPVPQGYFFDVTQNGKYGYSVHKWTILDNPYMPDPASFISDLIKKREWDSQHPTLLREWKNQWVLDVESLWIRYNEERNHYQELPSLPNNASYNYILGIDLGFKDSDALAVLAWSEHTPNTYLVKEVVTPKQGITELTQQIESLMKVYDFHKMVMDEGGLGKKIGEEIRRQKHLPIMGADKMRKQENVEFLNDALRSGKFKAKGNSRFAQDSYLVQIDWDKSRPDKIIIKDKPHSDIIDAVLYAFKESPAFTFRKEPDKPKPGSYEWNKAQTDSMFEAELEGLQKEHDYAKYVNGEEN